MANKYNIFYVIERTNKSKYCNYYYNGKTRLGSEMFSLNINDAKRYDNKEIAKKVANKLKVTFGKNSFKICKHYDTLDAQLRSFDALYNYLVEHGNTSNYKAKYVGETCANNADLFIIDIYVLPNKRPNTIYTNGGARNGCFLTFTEKDKISISDTTLLNIADKLHLTY